MENINETLGIKDNNSNSKQFKKSTEKNEQFEIQNESLKNNSQNKVLNVTLKGGVIGMLADSPQNSLNKRIKKENSNGWRVIQVIPASSGNILLIIFRIILLIITLFLFTTANGYYVIMEKK